VCALHSIVDVLGHASGDQPVQFQRCQRSQCRHGTRVGVHDRTDQAGLARPVERAFTGRHLVEHTAERPQVRARAGFLAFELLRRHVLKGADNGTLGGEWLRDGG
jgi:hypothetical protein